MTLPVEIHPLNDAFLQEALEISGTVMVSRGTLHHLGELPGYAALANGRVQGCIFYRIGGERCEIVSLDSRMENAGAGTALIRSVIETAQAAGCRTVWLITSNDNTKAIRFYQKRGFDLTAVHRDAITEARKLKPSIPLTGNDGIPIRHEIEFEYRLT
ncbi:GNAT family N-acetyltransferase [Paenibacillus sp. CN-4]|uniref:GNAT family N-acetyltransferase n=1 Tax=Paenibacillus nanchangensis TaxID=3348343 RepID=UPI00397E8F2D